MARVVSALRPVTRRIAKFAPLLLIPAVAWTVWSAPLRAQDPPQTRDYTALNDQAQAVDYSDDVPAHIAIVDGSVSLERDGKVETAEENVPLLAGDRLRTQRGRSEIMFGDGSALDLDEDTSIDLLSESLVRLRAGRIRLSIARQTEDLAYRVDAAGVSSVIHTTGEYRVSLNASDEVELAVFRGAAELTNDRGRTLVRAGGRALATERTEPSPPLAFNSSAWDPFEVWIDNLRQERLGHESAQYLPADLRYYGGTFDTYGGWSYDNTYGYVWYPHVDVGWRPYSVGSWSFYGSFGWTWVGYDRWSWPTHHYGRWGLHGSSWFWIPDRRWSPAWVSWGVAPGYVSWCPLGFDGRPVVAVTTVTTRYVSPWSAWTFAPTHAFAPHVGVSRFGVAGDRIAVGVAGQVVTRAGGPVAPLGVGRAVAAPLRSPSMGVGVRGVAVPRGARSFSGSAAISSQPAVGSIGTPTVGSIGAPAGGSPSRFANPSASPRAVERQNDIVNRAYSSRGVVPPPNAVAPPQAVDSPRAFRSGRGNVVIQPNDSRTQPTPRPSDPQVDPRGNGAVPRSWRSGGSPRPDAPTPQGAPSATPDRGSGRGNGQVQARGPDGWRQSQPPTTRQQMGEARSAEPQAGPQNQSRPPSPTNESRTSRAPESRSAPPAQSQGNQGNGGRGQATPRGRGGM
jgi:Family of unknown function (DUF6600)/FecR protein